MNHEYDSYRLCAVIQGQEGHFRARILTPTGWYDLDDGKHEPMERKRVTTRGATFALFTKIPQGDLPAHDRYPTLERWTPNTCFMNASMHVFRLVWYCLKDGKIPTD